MAISCVLMVDDDDDLRLIGKLALADVGGWQTLLAGSGPEAITLAQENVPDVILLDMMMPEMDGRAVFERLRAADAT